MKAVAFNKDGMEYLECSVECPSGYQVDEHDPHKCNKCDGDCPKSKLFSFFGVTFGQIWFGVFKAFFKDVLKSQGEQMSNRYRSLSMENIKLMQSF